MRRYDELAIQNTLTQFKQIRHKHARKNWYIRKNTINMQNMPQYMPQCMQDNKHLKYARQYARLSFGNMKSYTLITVAPLAVTVVPLAVTVAPLAVMVAPLAVTVAPLAASGTVMTLASVRAAAHWAVISNYRPSFIRVVNCGHPLSPQAPLPPSPTELHQQSGQCIYTTNMQNMNPALFCILILGFPYFFAYWCIYMQNNMHNMLNTMQKMYIHTFSFIELLNRGRHSALWWYHPDLVSFLVYAKTDVIQILCPLRASQHGLSAQAWRHKGI